MELATAYLAESRLKSWRRTVRLDRLANVVEISEVYFLQGPVPDVTLNLSDRLQGYRDWKRKADFDLEAGCSPTLISFDAKLLNASVETIPLENAELKRNWGSEIYRIQLKTMAPAASGRLQLTISSM
jgi:hypothetical protein